MGRWRSLLHAVLCNDRVDERFYEWIGASVGQRHMVCEEPQREPVTWAA